MARIRTVKPEFWADEKLSPSNAVTRLVFLGLISMADDRGRLVDNVKQIDAFIFPETSETSRGALLELAGNGRIQRGLTASGQSIIQIVNWHHQRIEKPNYAAALPDIVSQSVQPIHAIPGSVLEESRIDTGSVLEASQNHIYDLRSTIYDLRSTTNDHTCAVSEPARVIDEQFSEVWTIYPKREGGNSRHDALKAYRARRRTGVEHQAMLEGTQRYAKYCQEKGWVRTAFVKMGAVFFGPAEHYLETWEVGPTPEPRARMNPEDRVSQTIAAISRRGES